MIVTRDGRPVAKLRPLPRRSARRRGPARGDGYEHVDTLMGNSDIRPLAVIMKFMPSQSRSKESDTERYPAWFVSFLADRAIVKPSPHTAKAYRQDFEAIAVLLCGGRARVGDLRLSELTRDALHDAFGAYPGATPPPQSGAVGRRGTRCVPSFTPTRCCRPIRCRSSACPKCRSHFRNRWALTPYPS